MKIFNLRKEMMMASTMKNLSFKQFCISQDLKLTDLRKDILAILYNAKKPMGAYEILEKLRETRNGSEPPTVYRVLKWLVNSQLVHRVESMNAYVCCSKSDIEKHIHKTILLLCNHCKNSQEFEDTEISHSIRNFVKKNNIKVDDKLIEMKGLCNKCSHKTSSK